MTLAPVKKCELVQLLIFTRCIANATESNSLFWLWEMSTGLVKEQLMVSSHRLLTHCQMVAHRLFMATENKLVISFTLMTQLMQLLAQQTEPVA